MGIVDSFYKLLIIFKGIPYFFYMVNLIAEVNFKLVNQEIHIFYL